MNRSLIVFAILLSLLWAPRGEGIGGLERCEIEGGSTAKGGTNCPGSSIDWWDVTFSVTALCKNGCTGGTWTKNSSNHSMQSSSACVNCPLRVSCQDCLKRQSDQAVEYYTEVQKRKQKIWGPCEVTSSQRATVTCYCPGCGNGSPILISLHDEGYRLTDAANGVLFDLDGDGAAEQTAWTARGSDEGFLALDRNLNGTIDDFMELFGKHTPQLPSDEPNGWLALAVWDDSLNGGNEDGVIDARDEIFGSLQIWVDRNHNGFSERNELWSLERAGLEYLSLDYDSEEGWVDEFGNGFRYPSRVGKTRGKGDTIAWDVFFAPGQ